ncbi:hypothetical protein [uncultured Capnocytophaga sp.]|uniref:hypothetical protein n=1 Tax=uncultured Capnocytophaga sp. TaxID=159273 RepID=UPI0028E762DA|nr:hypothetical protein [uncultured Capnocytophaga sp.]
MPTEIIISLITSLLGGGVLGMLFERKKRKVETDAIEADVMDKMREMYVHFIDDYNKKYEELVRENEKLLEKVKKLEDRINELTK